jgi:hypothetical protein
MKINKALSLFTVLPLTAFTALAKDAQDVNVINTPDSPVPITAQTIVEYRYIGVTDVTTNGYA